MKKRKTVTLSKETIAYLEKLSRYIFGYENMSATIEFVMTRQRKKRAS